MNKDVYTWDGDDYFKSQDFINLFYVLSLLKVIKDLNISSTRHWNGEFSIVIYVKHD